MTDESPHGFATECSERNDLCCRCSRQLSHHHHPAVRFRFCQNCLPVATVCFGTSSAVQTDDNPGAMGESEKGESCVGNGCRDVVSGAGCDVALFARDESLRSLSSSEIVASIGVVLRGVRWLQIGANLKIRRSVDFDFAKTAGWRKVRRLTARF